MKSAQAILIVLLITFFVSSAVFAGTVRYRVVAEAEYVYQAVPTDFFIIEGWDDGILTDSVLLRIDGDYLMYYGDLVYGTPVFESEPVIVEKVANITPGDAWVSNLEDFAAYQTAVGLVQKTVPAGTFTAMEIDMWDTNNHSVHLGKKWMAAGVGLLGFEGEYLGVTAYQLLTSYTYVGGVGFWPVAVGNDLLFETGESMVVVDAPFATITIDGDPSDWAPYDPVVEDPMGDDPSVYGGVDIEELYIANDDTTLYMMFRFWDGGPTTLWGGSRYGAYQVYVMTDNDESEEIGYISYYYGGDFWFLSPINFGFDGTMTACGDVMECSIPLANLGYPDSLYRYSLSVGDMDEDYDKSNMVGVNLSYTNQSCCLPPTVSDVNQSGNVDITDISVMIDHQFLTLVPLVCDAEGDLDFSGEVDITDLSLMIDNQFLTLTPLPPCP